MIRHEPGRLVLEVSSPAALRQAEDSEPPDHGRNLALLHLRSKTTELQTMVMTEENSASQAAQGFGSRRESEIRRVLTSCQRAPSTVSVQMLNECLQWYCRLLRSLWPNGWSGRKMKTVHRRISPAVLAEESNCPNKAADLATSQRALVATGEA